MCVCARTEKVSPVGRTANWRRTEQKREREGEREREREWEERREKDGVKREGGL